MRLSALATLTAAAALTCAAPALAQYAAGAPAANPSTAVEELTVTGHLNGSRLQSLSEGVSFADLDLTYAGDRERLRVRVNDAARRVCTRLNQDAPNPANMGKSCQEMAMRGALDQVRYAFADARDRAYADSYGAPASAEVADPGYAPR
jgi:UrcA family protein